MQRLMWPFAPRGQSSLALHVCDAGAVDSCVASASSPLSAAVALTPSGVETTIVASSFIVLTALFCVALAIDDLTAFFCAAFLPAGPIGGTPSSSLQPKKAS